MPRYRMKVNLTHLNGQRKSAPNLLRGLQFSLIRKSYKVNKIFTFLVAKSNFKSSLKNTHTVRGNNIYYDHLIVTQVDKYNSNVGG